jgi:hypothetical protein
VVEGNGRDVVVQDVGFDDTVEQSAADEAKFTIDGSGGSTSVGPGIGVIVGKRGVGVLEVGNGD